MISSLLQKRYVRSSRLVCFVLFGFSPSPQNRMTLWDNTSLVLKKAIIKWVEKRDSVLEVGTGDIGLLSNFLDRRIEADITSIDICAEFIENSKKNRKKGSDIIFIESDLFKNLEKHKKFDIIFSNPPYVKTTRINPEGHMKYHAFKKEEMLFYSSDGGEFGTKVISGLIHEASVFLNRNGSLLIGYNQKHIDEKRISEIINNSEFYLFDSLYSKRTTCKVINLKLKQ